MGVIVTAKVIIKTDKTGQPKLVQLGNQKWVIIIETINTFRVTIPPLIIFKAVMHQATQYKNNIIPHNQLIGVSNNS